LRVRSRKARHVTPVPSEYPCSGVRAR
jgi:hypothetical protein